MAMDRIYDSAEGFGRALDRLVDQFEEESSDAVRKTVIDFGGKVISDTPRDTGRAAVGWILTSDQPSEFVPPEGEYEEPGPPEDPGDAANFMWWFVNNLEYIEPLEDGHSDQAPTGMVANALNAFDKFLNDQLDGLETVE